MERKSQDLVGKYDIIKKLISEGKTHKEIESILGLTGDRPVHNLLKRMRKKEQNPSALKGKGRPRTVPPKETDYERRIKDLEMQVRLLKDFLLHTEGK